jgi:hypothetical protein
LFIPQIVNSRSYILAGDMFMFYDRQGKVAWGYDDGSYIHTHYQDRLVGVNRGTVNYLAVTHTWGDEASTKMFLNGIELPCTWRSKDAPTPGGSDPAFSGLTSTVEMGQEDILVQLGMSGVSKSAADIQNYAQGRL